MYNQCRLTPYPDNTTHSWPEAGINRVCSINQRGGYVCPQEFYCGNIEDYPEIPLENEKIYNKVYLNYGVTNYDNLASSMLTVFQMITSESWYFQIVNLMDADFPFLGALYCFAVIIIG